jgi:hypothetical protein
MTYKQILIQIHIKNMSKRIIEHNLDFYILDQDQFEPNEIFQQRINFILQNLESDTYKNLVKKSRLWACKKYFNCEYDHI